nr:CPXCG motif-containing cysteine-rich protein [Luteimonas saliphila]
MQDFETLDCPYCGEPVTLALDASADDQSYVEDCQVCCRPMLVAVAFDAPDSPRITLRREDE